jgi:hypothetical protein
MSSRSMKTHNNRLIGTNFYPCQLSLDSPYQLKRGQTRASLFFYVNNNSWGDVVAQLAKARLGEPDCNAAVPGSIPASSTVS